jgi:hypothetical protein
MEYLSRSALNLEAVAFQDSWYRSNNITGRIRGTESSKQIECGIVMVEYIEAYPKILVSSISECLVQRPEGMIVDKAMFELPPIIRLGQGWMLKIR